MCDGPESPQPQPREDAAKPAVSPGGEQAKKKQESREKRDPVEAVAECPGFRRQMLFTRPFNVYADVIDAAEQKNATQEKAVPSIYCVLDVTDDGSKMCVGDENGKKLGWINRDDNPGYEWNIRSVWKPSKRSLKAGTISAYVVPTLSTGNLQLPVTDKTLLPILEVKYDASGDVWYKVGPSLGGDTVASKIGRPVWIPERNDEQQKLNEDVLLLSSKNRIERFARELKLILDSEEQRQPHGRNSNLAIDAIRLSYLTFLGATHRAFVDEDITRINDYAHTGGLDLVVMRSEIELALP